MGACALGLGKLKLKLMTREADMAQTAKDLFYEMHGAGGKHHYCASDIRSVNNKLPRVIAMFMDVGTT